MQGTEKASKRRLSTAFLCVLTGGAMVALVGLMVSAPGCNTIFPPDPCANVDCNDDNLCTTDTCVEGECVNTDVVCTNGYECEEATGECVEVDLCEGVTCDDSDLCTTDECVDGECVYTDVACAEGETCDPATGECVAIECEEDADCDDADVCTTDACVDGICVISDLCAADEICTAAGECVECEEDADCADGEVCTEGVCVEAAACTEDADCDDGLYCNGIETCGTNGVCVDGDEPCEEDQTCEEGDGAAVCTDEVVPTVDFTLNQDSLSGTTGDDDFSAALIFNEANGAQIASLQTGDSANGLAGDDTLAAVFAPTAAQTIVPQSLSGIETYYLTNFGGFTVTLQATNISDLETVYTKNSVDDITVESLASVVNAGFMGMTDANDKLELDFVTAATTGSADAMTCYVENTTAGELEIDTGAANGIESLTFHSTGDTVNKLSTLNQTDGTSLATVYVTGEIGFTLENEADNTVRTWDASGMTVSSPGLTLGTGTTAATYTAFNTVDVKSITGSNGDDTFIFGTTLNGSDADQTGEKIDGGAGDDVLQATFTSSLATALPIDNIETLRVNATTAGGFTLLNVTDVSAISVEADGTATALAMTNIPVTSTTQTWPTLYYRGTGTAAAQTYDTVTYTPFGASAATGDSLTVSIGNRGTALNTSGTSNAHTITSLTPQNIETLTVNVTDGPLTMGTGIAAGTSSTLINVTVTGSSNVNLGTVTASGNTVTSFDASGVVGDFTATVDCFNGGTVNLGSGNDTLDLTGSGTTNASTIQAGAGNDTITGTGAVDAITGGAGTDTLNGAAGADTISGGDGNDTINGGDGDDSLTGGSGNDVFILSGDSDNDEDTITDFDAGTSSTAVDTIRFDISDLESRTACTDMVDTSNNSIASGDGTYVLLGSDGGTVSNADITGAIGTIANVTDLENALDDAGSSTIDYGTDLASDNDCILVAYDAGSSVHIAMCCITGTGNTTEEVDACEDVVIMSNVTDLTNFDSSDFTFID